MLAWVSVCEPSPHALRVAQQVLREAADVADEGRAVHHRLARRRDRLAIGGCRR